MKIEIKYIDGSDHKEIIELNNVTDIEKSMEQYQRNRRPLILNVINEETYLIDIDGENTEFTSEVLES